MAPNFDLHRERLSVARIFLVVVLSFLVFGYNQSALGGDLAFQSFTSVSSQIDTTNTKGAVKGHNSAVQGELSYTILHRISDPSVGTVVAIYTLGCLIGALSCTAVGNHLRHKKTLFVSTIGASIGLVFQASSYGLAQMIIGSLISGIGVCSVNTITPVWQSECSKLRNREKHVVMLGTFISTGTAAAAWVNYSLSYIQHSSVSWRLPLDIPLVFTATLVVSAFCFPKSPHWLV